ncbi:MULTISPECIES: hypothetical protein [Nostocales]|uniref:Uncharacterized protein n=3 Tax=Nostocales TaxID=1161 RepID=A0A0C1R4E0_9CYAN|nr:hypothetical protein [Tolypothrix bouteillei]KAF3889384.1 hypothetical protein DA73_0400030815 [Tolypothrix bouteillei VB521301]
MWRLRNETQHLQVFIEFLHGDPKPQKFSALVVLIAIQLSLYCDFLKILHSSGASQRGKNALAVEIAATQTLVSLRGLIAEPAEARVVCLAREFYFRSGVSNSLTLEMWGYTNKAPSGSPSGFASRLRRETRLQGWTHRLRGLIRCIVIQKWYIPLPYLICMLNRRDAEGTE